MSIIAVGCSHSGAPLHILERLAVPASGLGPFLTRLKAAVREALVLSTCNRTEVYALVGHSGSGADLVIQALAERADMRADELRPHLYLHADADAARHALRVASGLESMVLGEDQIQAQWKRALAHARIEEALGPVLDRLGAAALSCGKRVRTFTGIGRHSVSLESLAVRAAARRLGSLAGRDVVIVGTGESAALVARHLRSATDAAGEDGAPPNDARAIQSGHARITVVSRSLDKAEEFARTIGAAAAPVDDLPQILTQADAVFCCTSAPHVLVEPKHLADRASARPGAALVCVDLGMPRDIHAAVADVPGTTLVSLEELSRLAESHRLERRRYLPQAEAIVEAEVARFVTWRTARGTAGTVARLRQHADAIVEQELARSAARLAALSESDRDLVRAMLHRVVGKLLHPPSELLGRHPEGENIALALEYAFGLSRTTLDERLPGAPLTPPVTRADSIEEAAS